MIECDRCGVEVARQGLCVDCAELLGEVAPPVEVKTQRITRTGRRRQTREVSSAYGVGTRLPISMHEEILERTRLGESAVTIALATGTSSRTVTRVRAAARKPA